MKSRFVFLAPVLLLLAGCVTYSTVYDGNPVDPELVARIQVGVTTKAEVMQLLGSPHQVQVTDVSGLAESLIASAPGDGLTVKLDASLMDQIYIYERMKTVRFGFFAGLYNDYRSDTRSDRLCIVFDKDGKVLAVGWTQQAEQI